MTAKSPEVVDGMIDDSLLGILIILLVVMLSTGYVYLQQLQQGDGQQANAAANLARRALSTASALVKDTNDAKSMQRIREFVSTHPDLKSNDTTPGGVKAHKILFCTTSIGKIAFVRQIEPHVHVEVDSGVVRDLEKHVPHIVHIPTTPVDAATSSVPNVAHELWDHDVIILLLAVFV
ncbi:hypothetical protein BBJ29_006091 [Phytophthora kernoviae]|uniref:Uncharacterized protein n=1 Tax=Phytophthora kernoviae TaxID=325452 RepID=A0A3F2RI87_9STRA|nr:hypothetical protein BBJ29_006091 [Phytophthora kernoviae]RLN57584.1 hypothetical protein BBP00_00007440 [Phytophthora kernoviae]